jgi:hypothetical protein
MTLHDLHWCVKSVHSPHEFGKAYETLAGSTCSQFVGTVQSTSIYTKVIILLKFKKINGILKQSNAEL